MPMGALLLKYRDKAWFYSFDWAVPPVRRPTYLQRAHDSRHCTFGSKRRLSSLKCAPRCLTMPDHPEPTSFALTRDLHPSAETIAITVCDMLGLPHRFVPDPGAGPHDVPGAWFKARS
jgi:hypothetical protein